MAQLREQVVVGVVPPQFAEARIAFRWPSVARFGGPARIGSGIQEFAKGLIRKTIDLPTVIAAVLLIPVVALATLIALAAWAMLAPLYFSKILPIFMTQYVVTNRRVMILRGWSLKPSVEVKLDEITDVRVVPNSHQPFFLAADLEFLGNGKVIMTMPGVPEFEQFRLNILDACKAWASR